MPLHSLGRGRNTSRSFCLFSRARANLKSHLDLHLIVAVCSERPKLLISFRFNCLTPEVLIWAPIVYNSDLTLTSHCWLPFNCSDYLNPVWSFWRFGPNLIFWWPCDHLESGRTGFRFSAMGVWQYICTLCTVYSVKHALQWMACQCNSRPCIIYSVYCSVTAYIVYWQYVTIQLCL